MRQKLGIRFFQFHRRDPTVRFSTWNFSSRKKFSHFPQADFENDNQNIEKIRPASNAHLVPAFEVALSLFADYDAHRADGFQPELDDHWMWYITNGHLQCADCICYPEIGDPDFYQATGSLT